MILNKDRRLERHNKFAKGDNGEPMIHETLIDVSVDKVEYDMIDDYYDRNKITSVGNKLG